MSFIDKIQRWFRKSKPVVPIEDLPEEPFSKFHSFRLAIPAASQEITRIEQISNRYELPLFGGHIGRDGNGQETCSRCGTHPNWDNRTKRRHKHFPFPHMVRGCGICGYSWIERCQIDNPPKVRDTRSSITTTTEGGNGAILIGGRSIDHDEPCSECGSHKHALDDCNMRGWWVGDDRTCS